MNVFQARGEPGLSLFQIAFLAWFAGFLRRVIAAQSHGVGSSGVTLYPLRLPCATPVSYNTRNTDVAIKLKIPSSSCWFAQSDSARRRRCLRSFRAVLLRSLCLLLRSVRPHHHQKDERADFFDVGKDLSPVRWRCIRETGSLPRRSPPCCGARAMWTPTTGQTRRWAHSG